MAEHSSNQPSTSRDFLRWGKELLKDALAKPQSQEPRQTRPFDAQAATRKQTGLLDGVQPFVPARASVSDLACLNIVFLDNAQRPLYDPLGRSDSPFSAEAERVILDRCLACLREVQDRLTALEDLVPRGRYLGLPLAQVVETVSTRDLKAFFYFVRENPRYFIGKSLRFAEAFVAWVVDHGEANAPMEPP